MELPESVAACLELLDMSESESEDEEWPVTVMSKIVAAPSPEAWNPPLVESKIVIPSG